MSVYEYSVSTGIFFVHGKRCWEDKKWGEVKRKSARDRRLSRGERW